MSYLCQSKIVSERANHRGPTSRWPLKSSKGQKLFDSRGYLYCVYRCRNGITYWHCSFRGKFNHCPASVIQHPESTVGVEHDHVGEVGLPETSKLTAAIKRKATWSRYCWHESVMRGAFRSLSGSAVAGVCLPLEPGPLEKSSRARPSDCVCETGLRMVPLGD